MKKPTAIIDKSLLQAICEQPPDERDLCFNAMLAHYVLVVPEILLEEVWVNLANPSPGKSPATIKMMVDCLLHLCDAWIAEPLEIAFVELVKHESIEILPKPPPFVMDSFFILRPDDAGLRKWVKERKQLHKTIIRQRVSEHVGIFDTKTSAAITSEREFGEQFMRPKLLAILSDPTRKRSLLEGVFGVTFRTRYPDCSKEIDAAFEEYSQDTFDRYPVTFNCIMAVMFYLHAPLCKIVHPHGKECKTGYSRIVVGSKLPKEGASSPVDRRFSLDFMSQVVPMERVAFISHTCSTAAARAIGSKAAPLLVLSRSEPIKNLEEPKYLGRSLRHQQSNLNDEKYVQSALLCARLATRDRGMRNIMELFKACGLWNGQTVFIDPRRDVTVRYSDIVV